MSITIEASALRPEDFGQSSRQTTQRSGADPTELLGLIARAESNDNPNVIFGGEERPLTSMTIKEVRALQDQLVQEGAPSSAAGKYQIIRNTLDDLVKRMGLTGDEPFTEEMQDRMAKQLLELRGWGDLQANNIDESTFIKNLSKEWASLPKDQSGKSYYEGDGLNEALVSYEDTTAAVQGTQTKQVATASDPFVIESSALTREDFSQGRNLRPSQRLPKQYGGTFQRGVRRGKKQSAGLYGQFIREMGESSGISSWIDVGDELVQEAFVEAIRNPAPIEDIDDIHSLASAGTFAVNAVGEQIINLGIAGVATAASLLTGGTAAAGLTAYLTRAGIAKAAAREMALKALPSKTFQAGLGTFAGFLPLNTGEIIQEQRDAGLDPSLGSSLLLGVPSTMLDVAGLGIAASTFFRDAKKEAVELTMKQVLARMGYSSVKSLAAEGGTEAVQEAMVIASRKLKDPTFSISDAISSSEGLSRIAFAGLSGAVVGGVLGGAGGVARGTVDSMRIGMQRAQLRTDELRRSIENELGAPEADQDGNTNSLFGFNVAREKAVEVVNGVIKQVNGALSARRNSELPQGEQESANLAAHEAARKAATYLGDELKTTGLALGRLDTIRQEARVKLAKIMQTLAQAPKAEELSPEQNKAVRAARDKIKKTLDSLKGLSTEEQLKQVPEALKVVDEQVAKVLEDPLKVPVARVRTLVRAVSKALDASFEKKAQDGKALRELINKLQIAVAKQVSKKLTEPQPESATPVTTPIEDLIESVKTVAKRQKKGVSFGINRTIEEVEKITEKLRKRYPDLRVWTEPKQGRTVVTLKDHPGYRAFKANMPHDVDTTEYEKTSKDIAPENALVLQAVAKDGNQAGMEVIDKTDLTAVSKVTAKLRKQAGPGGKVEIVQPHEEVSRQVALRDKELKDLDTLDFDNPKKGYRRAHVADSNTRLDLSDNEEEIFVRMYDYSNRAVNDNRLFHAELDIEGNIKREDGKPFRLFSSVEQATEAFTKTHKSTQHKLWGSVNPDVVEVKLPNGVKGYVIRVQLRDGKTRAAEKQLRRAEERGKEHTPDPNKRIEALRPNSKTTRFHAGDITLLGMALDVGSTQNVQRGIRSNPQAMFLAGLAYINDRVMRDADGNVVTWPQVIPDGKLLPSQKKLPSQKTKAAEPITKFVVEASSPVGLYYIDFRPVKQVVDGKTIIEANPADANKIIFGKKTFIQAKPDPKRLIPTRYDPRIEDQTEVHSLADARRRPKTELLPRIGTRIIEDQPKKGQLSLFESSELTGLPYAEWIVDEALAGNVPVNDAISVLWGYGLWDSKEIAELLNEEQDTVTEIAHTQSYTTLNRLKEHLENIPKDKVTAEHKKLLKEVRQEIADMEESDLHMIPDELADRLNRAAFPQDETAIDIDGETVIVPHDPVNPSQLQRQTIEQTLKSGRVVTGTRLGSDEVVGDRDITDEGLALPSYEAYPDYGEEGNELGGVPHVYKKGSLRSRALGYVVAHQDQGARLINYIWRQPTAEKVTKWLMDRLNIKEQVVLFDEDSATLLQQIYNIEANDPDNSAARTELYKSYRDFIKNVIEEETIGRTYSYRIKGVPANEQVIHIFVSKSQTRVGQTRAHSFPQTLGHELGHVVEKVYFNRLVVQNAELAEEILSAFNDSPYTDPKYGLGFEQGRREAFADYMSKVAVDMHYGRKTKVSTDVENFFAQIVATLKELWETIYNEFKKALGLDYSFKYPKTFGEFVDALHTHTARQRGEKAPTPEGDLAKQILAELDSMSGSGAFHDDSFAGQAKKNASERHARDIARAHSKGKATFSIHDAKWRIATMKELKLQNPSLDVTSKGAEVTLTSKTRRTEKSQPAKPVPQKQAPKTLVPKIERANWVKRSDLRQNPHKIFIFGDNDRRAGKGGQALAMRGEKNAIGIRTKKAPHKGETAYYTDAELAENKRKIDEDFNKVLKAVRQGKTIVIPGAGLGTGLSEMQTRAPKTLAYINEWIDRITAAAGEEVQARPLEDEQLFVDPTALQTTAPTETSQLTAKEEAQLEKQPSIINIWHQTGENAELSNMAYRPFKWEGREYVSVEHAYQTNKSGKFNKAVYENTRWGNVKDGWTVKVDGGKAANPVDQEISRSLMKKLIRASLNQNPAAKKALTATGNATFTHKSGRGADFWTKAFPEILTELRAEYRETQAEVLSQQAERQREIAEDRASDRAADDAELGITFEEHESSGYPGRTYANAAAADITIDFAKTKTGSGGRSGMTQQAAKKAGKVYINIPVDENGQFDEKAALTAIGRAIRERQALKLLHRGKLSVNIAGHGVYSVGHNQAALDAAVTKLMKQVHRYYPLKSVRSGGQTGFDEAGAKAGRAIGVPTTVLVPKGYRFRQKAGVDTRGEAALKARYESELDTAKRLKAEVIAAEEKYTAYEKETTKRELAGELTDAAWKVRQRRLKELDKEYDKANDAYSKFLDDNNMSPESITDNMPMDTEFAEYERQRDAWYGIKQRQLNFERIRELTTQLNDPTPPPEGSWEEFERPGLKVRLQALKHHNEVLRQKAKDAGWTDEEIIRAIKADVESVKPFPPMPEGYGDTDAELMARVDERNKKALLNQVSNAAKEMMAKRDSETVGFLNSLKDMARGLGATEEEISAAEKRGKRSGFSIVDDMPMDADVAEGVKALKETILAPFKVARREVGLPLPQEKTEGICNGTCGIVTERLKNEGFTYGRGDIKAKSPLGDWLIGHIVALTTINGERYIINQPQGEFMERDFNIDNVWEDIFDPMRDMIKSSVPGSMRELYSMGEIPIEEMLKGEENIVDTDVGSFDVNHIENIQTYTENGETWYEANFRGEKVKKAKVRWRLDDGYMTDIQFKSHKAPAVFTNENFTPRLIRVDAETLAKTYGTDIETAEQNVEWLNKARLYDGRDIITGAESITDNMPMDNNVDEAVERTQDEVFRKYVNDMKNLGNAFVKDPRLAAKMLLFPSNSELMSMGSPLIEWVAKKFHAVPGSNDDSRTVFTLVRQNEARFMTALKHLLAEDGPIPEAHIPFHEMFLYSVSRGKIKLSGKTLERIKARKRLMNVLLKQTPDDQVPVDLKEKVDTVRSYLTALHTWLTTPLGDEVTIELDGRRQKVKGMGMKIGFKQFYAPLMLDTHQIASRREEFMKILQKHDFSEKDSRDIRAALERDENGGLNNGFQTDQESGETLSMVNFFGPGFANVAHRSENWTDALRNDMIDAGFYQADLTNMLVNYTNLAVRRATWQKEFGEHNITPEIARRYKKLNDRIGEDVVNPHSPVAKIEYNVWKAYADGQINEWQRQRVLGDILPGYAGQLGFKTNSKIRNIQSWAVIFENILLLPFAIFSQFVDVGTIFARGDWQSHRAGLRGMMNKMSRDEAREALAALGAIRLGTFEHALNDQAISTFYTSTAKRINDAFFRVNMMEGWTNMMRTMALMSAREFIQRNGRKAAEGDKKALKKISELGLTVADVQAWDGHSLNFDTNTKIKAAVNRYIDEGMIRPTPAQRPTWMNDPGYLVFSHLKSFLYGFHETFLRRVGREARIHHNLLPLLALMLVTLPLAAIGYDLRRKITGRGNAPEGVDYAQELFERAGLFGVFQLVMDMQQADQYGKPAALALAGPTVEHLYTFLTTDDKDIVLAKSIPIVAQIPAAREWIKQRDMFGE